MPSSRSQPEQHRVVVVGAGISGLTSALLLSAEGLDVTLLDGQGSVGGKMRQLNVAGAAVDSGPTVFSMRWVFDELLNSLGESLDSLVTLQPLTVLAHHVWERAPNESLDLFADRAASADAIAQFSSPNEARRFERFCDQAAKVYRALEGPYMRLGKPSLPGMGLRLGAQGLGTLAGLGPFANLWASLSRHFTDPRLRQLFGRYATYTGSSPWAAPATLMLVAQVEMNGVWQVREGMHGFASALAGLAQRRGVKLRLGARCERIELTQGRVSGVRLPKGERLVADSVVFSGDISALANGLLGPEVTTAAQTVALNDRSLSAITWSVNAKVDDGDAAQRLKHHNVFFAEDYASEFEDIFNRQRLPKKATVYVCAQDRGETPTTPTTAERLLCLVNAPATGDVPSFTKQDLDACEQACFERMARCGLSVQASVLNTVRTSPVGFNQLFPGSGGALYGRATHGWMALFKRPGAASAIPGLYLAGGGVHPGPGVPMAALSGQRAAEALLANLSSTSRLQAVATFGGTSTRSATTAATH